MHTDWFIPPGHMLSFVASYSSCYCFFMFINRVATTQSNRHRQWSQKCFKEFKGIPKSGQISKKTLSECCFLVCGRVIRRRHFNVWLQKQEKVIEPCRQLTQAFLDTVKNWCSWQPLPWQVQKYLFFINIAKAGSGIQYSATFVF